VTEPLQIMLGDEAVPVKVRRNAQAKRMVLRVCPTTGEVKLTLPKRSSLRQAQKFLAGHLDWIDGQRDKADSVAPLGHGDSVLYLGQPHQIEFTDQSPRKVLAVGGVIRVGGPTDLAPGRLLKWFKASAKEALTDASEAYADLLDVRFNRVSIGDMKSRWGSCSSRGTLRYNWRLVLAPHDVLRYVAAHEVAHLLEMNHSDRFWAHVARCEPDYQTHRRWLKRHGSDLFAVKL
jgi:hypothetical protein